MHDSESRVDATSAKTQSRYMIAKTGEGGRGGGGAYRVPAVLHEGDQAGRGHPPMQPHQLRPLGQLAMLVCYSMKHLLHNSSSILSHHSFSGNA